MSADPKPTIGRVVHYHLIDTGQAVPAIVTAVDKTDPEILELHIMNPRYVTPEGELVAAACYPGSRVKRGDVPGCWQWPPRAPERSS